MTVLETISTVALAIVAIGTAIAGLIAWAAKQQSRIDKAEAQTAMSHMELRLTAAIQKAGEPERIGKIEVDIASIKAQLVALTRYKTGE